MTESGSPGDDRILKTCTFCGVQTVGDAPACARCGRPFSIPRTSGENEEGTRPGESSPAKQPGAYCMRCGVQPSNESILRKVRLTVEERNTPRR